MFIGRSAMAMGGLKLIANIIAGITALLRIHRKQIAIIQALGASPFYTISYLWLYVLTIITLGIISGLILGWAASYFVGMLFTKETGISFAANITFTELVFVAITFAVSAVLAMVTILLTQLKPFAEVIKER